jgi:Ca2+-binding EF-hand superfamily protein
MRAQVKSEYNVTMEQLQEYTEVFDFFDRDHSGTIDMDEFACVMRALGEHQGDREFRACL